MNAAVAGETATAPHGSAADGKGAAVEDLPGALIIPSDPRFFDTRICGLPLLERMVCALDRATAGVTVLQPPGCEDGAVRGMQRAAANRARQPRLAWSRSATSVSTAGGLFVVFTAGVFDQRLCAAVARIPEREGKIVRYRRPGDALAPVWYVGREPAGELLRRFADGTPSADEITAFLESYEVVEVDPGGNVCAVVTDERSRKAAEEKLLNLARKGTDTWIARNIDRNVSMQLTRWLVRLPLTPNQVTLAATVCGLAGAVLLGFGTYATQLFGSALLVFSIIVDGCDGEVARLKFMESEFGRRLDFFLDNVVNVLAIFMVGAGHYWQGGPSFYLYASLANAAAALASVFPVYFLFFRTARPGAAPDAPKKQGMNALMENVAGRDYVYLVFALAIIGRGYWFTYFCLGGIGVFLFLMLILLARQRLSGTAQEEDR